MSPVHQLHTRCVADRVSYVDGIPGGNVVVVTGLGARRLARLRGRGARRLPVAGGPTKAALAGARVAPSGWRRAKAMLQHDATKELRRRERETSPFDVGRPTGPKAKLAVWCEPELVCEVSWTEWTNEGTLRQPAFKGMRSLDDKDPHEVVREFPQGRR